MKFNKNDRFTIEGIGYDRSGRLCVNGRRLGITKGRKPILFKLKEFRVAGIDKNGDIDLGKAFKDVITATPHRV